MYAISSKLYLYIIGCSPESTVLLWSWCSPFAKIKIQSWLGGPCCEILTEWSNLLDSRTIWRSRNLLKVDYWRPNLCALWMELEILDVQYILLLWTPSMSGLKTLVQSSPLDWLPNTSFSDVESLVANFTFALWWIHECTPAVRRQWV